MKDDFRPPSTNITKLNIRPYIESPYQISWVYIKIHTEAEHAASL